MASIEEKAEKARVEALEQAAAADRARELARRADREVAASTDESLIVHGPASE